MFTLDRPVTFSQDIKKSRFIAFAAPVAGEEDAKNFLAAHSDPDANHNCWAWRSGQTYRFTADQIDALFTTAAAEMAAPDRLQ